MLIRDRPTAPPSRNAGLTLKFGSAKNRDQGAGLKIAKDTTALPGGSYAANPGRE